MHGLGPTLRQFIVTSKPWQRMAFGVLVVAVGVLLQNYVLTAFGVVFIVLPAAGWIKRRRGGAVAEPDEGEVGATAIPDVPMDAADG